MTKAELIELLEKRRLDAENVRYTATHYGNRDITGWMRASGRLEEIDNVLTLLKANFIRE